MDPGTPKDELARAREALDRAGHPLLTTHVNSDGDGLGSELSLYRFLTERGKTVTILNPSPTPSFFRFLDPEGVIRQYQPGEMLPAGVDLLVALDFGKWERLGKMADAAESSGLPVLCMDHHPSEEKFGDREVIFDRACATAEIVYDLLKSYGGPLSLRTAEALYAGIMTDTGSFRFTNTNARTHHIAAELLALGVDPAAMYSSIYESTHPERLRLLGLALSGLQISGNGRIGWIAVTQEMLQEAGARPEDTEDFVDVPRTLSGVEVSILFIELPTGIIRTSLRSKGIVRVSEVAMSLGGGGHPFAAGIRVKGPLKEAIQRVVTRTEEAIRATMDGGQLSDRQPASGNRETMAR
ncbi:MAG: bifunctional oligoribonuclease/PAP phosphatase NrnA [Nitrospinota bacterium]